MSYTNAQLLMDRAALSPISTSLSKRDDWVENVGGLLAAAGWTIRASGSTFTVDTLNVFILSFKVFAASDGSDDAFWRITRLDNGEFIHVIDDPKASGYQPPGRVIRTGSTDPAVNHPYIVAAIMILLGDKNPRIISAGSLSTIIALEDSPRNDFAVNITIGSSLRTGTTDAQAWAGVVCTSQANKKKYVKNGSVTEKGDDNYLSVYLTSKAAGGGDLDNNQVHMSVAKNFSQYAVDTPKLIGEQSASTFGRLDAQALGERGMIRMGALDLYRTIALANPYQLILHVESSPLAFIVASALKLIDLRKGTNFESKDIPITAATVFVAGGIGTGHFNFRKDAKLFSASAHRIVVNDKAFYGTQSGAATPQLIIFQTAGDKNYSVDGCLWRGELGEVCSPWLTLLPKASGQSGGAGQLPDAMTIYERTPAPTLTLFSWDRQNWIRYTKSALGADLFPYTLCLRVTGKFISPH